MSREVKSSRCPAIVVAVGCAATLLFGAANIATQSRIIKPPTSGNTNSASKRQRVATLRASDSPDGSRVALSSDQSLNDYEAYRRGDRFYVRIPPADVPRAEIVRGRAFGDVKVQRSADSTVVSFRLQPGATARVEQRGNKLDVVFKMPGGSAAATTPSRDVARNNAGPMPPANSNRRVTSNANTSTQPYSQRGTTNKNSADRTTYGNTKPSPLPTPKPSPSPAGSPAIAKSSPSPQSSPGAKSSPPVAQSKSSPTASPNTSAAQGSTWGNLKKRAGYWLLMAQLNPLPVAIGVGVLLLLIGLLLLQRRRAKATKRVRRRKEPKMRVADPRELKTKPIVETPGSVIETAKSSVPEPVEAAAVVSTAAVASSLASAAPSEEAPRERVNGDRHERVTRVSEEVKKIMAGGDYDENIVASEDPDTRKLVGAELLSALVGRNLQRRERARAAFMKHGYFDDATRDLRTADSANERAAAARRLSFVHDREATPHLIGGLEDPSPDVRRASVEALMDLRDPAAIAPLNSLMQTETDRKVPRTLLKHAIEACATGGADAEPLAEATTSVSESITKPAESEREVIEI